MYTNFSYDRYTLSLDSSSPTRAISSSSVTSFTVSLSNISRSFAEADKALIESTPYARAFMPAIRPTMHHHAQRNVEICSTRKAASGSSIPSRYRISYLRFEVARGSTLKPYCNFCLSSQPLVCVLCMCLYMHIESYY